MVTSDVCLTPQCVTAAAEIIHNLHPNYDQIDPCERFDDFSCGGFPSRFPAETSPSVFGRVALSNINIISTMLSTDPPALETDDEEDIYEMLVNSLGACMNTTTVSETGPLVVSEIVARATELFPLGDDGYSSNETMTEEDLDNFAAAAAYLTTVGVPLFGDFFTFQDMENPDTVVPGFSVSWLYRIDQHLPPTSPPLFLTYAETNSTIPDKLTPFMPTKEGEEAVPELYEGLLTMIESLVTVEALSGFLTANTSTAIQGLWQTSTISEAAEGAPALAIDKIIALLVPEGYETDRIALPYTEVYPLISDVVASTPKAVLQAFMILRIVENYEEFITGGGGDSAEGAVAERFASICFSHLDLSLPWIMSKFFTDKVYTEEHHKAAVTASEAVKDVFIKRVNGSTWLSDETRELVLEKARDVQLNVGFPEENPDAGNATSLKAYYDGINITESYAANAVSIRQWAANKAFNETLLEPINRMRWLEMGVHSYNMNARAGREYNMIMMPSSMTLFPHYAPGLPEYMLYARYAYISAHEIVHNFDDLGMAISNERKPEEWLSADSAAAFSERTECLVEQYSNVTVNLADGTVVRDPVTNGTLKINGTQTLSENIADQGGLSIAYEAWKQTMDECARTNVTQQALPGLENFTLDQVFFLAFGQTWCNNPTEEGIVSEVAGEAHSPGFARTRITTRNSEGFGEAWKCKKKEPECKVW